MAQVGGSSAYSNGVKRQRRLPCHYDAKLGDANLQPFANLAYIHLGETGFAETGAPVAEDATAHGIKANFAVTF